MREVAMFGRSASVRADERIEIHTSLTSSHYV
jgi:hypothetical protein